MKINLNDKWTIKKAKELYTYTSGISKGSQFFGTGYPYLTFTEIFHNYFVPDELTSLVQSNDRERENCSIKRGDVFLTRTSETDNELGMSCVALKDYPNATFNGFTKRLRPLTDDVIPEYAGFYFRSPIFRAAVTSMSSIITRASLNEKMLDKLPVCYPSKKAQKKIASILSAYDNLIQNYKKQIEALQTAASELYKEWFVRFRFPGWQNAKFGNGIPEGWKVERLGNLAEIKSGKRLPQGYNFSDYPTRHPYIRARDIKHGNIDSNDFAYISDEVYQKLKRYIVDENDILLTIVANIGDVGYVNKSLLGFNLTENAVRLTNYSKRIEPRYLCYYLSQPATKIYMEGLAVGAAQAKLGIYKIETIKVLLPNINIQKDFSRRITLIHTKIDNLNKQITNLTQQRDLLLPRLMSGKLEI